MVKLSSSQCGEGRSLSACLSSILRTHVVKENWLLKLPSDIHMYTMVHFLSVIDIALSDTHINAITVSKLHT